MANLENVIFALGNDNAYFFNAPAEWAYNKLPSEVQDRFSARKVADVIVACFGDNAERYFFSLEEKGDKDESRHNIVSYYGDECSQALKDYVNEVAARGDLQHLKVVLGTGQSFFAWDRVSIRWESIPKAMEGIIQGWLSPMGWTRGPPTIVALGKNNSYFVRSGYGAWNLQSGGQQGLYKLFEAFQRQDMVSQIKNAWFNPCVSDSFVVLMSNSRVYGNQTGDQASYRKTARSFATPTIEAIYEAEWAAEAKEEQAEKEAKAKAQRKAEERRKAAEAATRAEQQRKRQQEEAQQKLLKRSYTEWKDHCDDLFAPTSSAKISEFPHLPIDICVCTSEICWTRKTDTELFACRHDVEKLLRASGKYSLAWLRTERLAWHPDRFGRKCEEQQKEALVKKTTELYAIFEELIAAEAPSDD